MCVRTVTKLIRGLRVGVSKAAPAQPHELYADAIVFQGPPRKYVRYSTPHKASSASAQMPVPVKYYFLTTSSIAVSNSCKPPCLLYLHSHWERRLSFLRPCTALMHIDPNTSDRRYCCEHIRVDVRPSRWWVCFKFIPPCTTISKGL